MAGAATYAKPSASVALRLVSTDPRALPPELAVTALRWLGGTFREWLVGLPHGAQALQPCDLAGVPVGGGCSARELLLREQVRGLTEAVRPCGRTEERVGVLTLHADGRVCLHMTLHDDGAVCCNAVMLTEVMLAGVIYDRLVTWPS